MNATYSQWLIHITHNKTTSQNISKQERLQEQSFNSYASTLTSQNFHLATNSRKWINILS